MSYRDSRQRAEFFLDGAAAFTRLGRLAYVRRRERGSGGNTPEVALGESESFLGRNIAKHQQHGIRGGVIGAKKCLHVIERSGIEVGEIAVEIVGVGPIAVSDGR